MTVTNAVSQPPLTRAALVVDIVAKVGLVVLLIIAIADPLGALVVPALWWLRWRRRPFPWLGDALVTLPWFTDTPGNRLSLFDTVDFFDDALHDLGPVHRRSAGADPARDRESEGP